MDFLDTVQPHVFRADAFRLGACDKELTPLGRAGLSHVASSIICDGCVNPADAGFFYLHPPHCQYMRSIYFVRSAKMQIAICIPPSLPSILMGIPCTLLMRIK